MLRVAWVFAALAIYWATLVSCEVKYVVSGPKMVRPGTSYLLGVTTSSDGGVAEKYWLNVTINSKGDKTNLFQKMYKLKTGETDVLTLNIPMDVPEGWYTLYVNSLNGVSYSGSQTLSVSRKMHSLVIQTDKRLYKPAQTCHYRVIAFLPDLLPYTEEINITIYDVASNKIAKLVNQKNQYGVITNELELSNVTPLGTWKIVAETRYAKEEALFQVAQYVLPKFEVLLDTPKHFFVNKNNPRLQEELKFSVIAKYTYGKPVKGTASVGIRLNYNYWYFTEPRPVITKLLELKDGKADISLSTSDLERLLPSVWSYRDISYRTFFFEANVTETITGVVLTGNNIVACRPNRLQLKFLPGSQSNYKPGLIYKAYLALTNSDDTPVKLSDLQDSTGEFRSLAIKITNTFPYVYYPRPIPAPEPLPLPLPLPEPEFEGPRIAPLSLSVPYLTTLPPTPQPTLLQQNFEVKLDKNGHAYFELATQLKSESINIKATFFDEVASSETRAFKYISHFKTRDQGGIQIALKNSPNVIKPNSVVNFDIKTIHSVDTIYFQMMAKGVIVRSRTVGSGKPRTSHDFSMLFTDNLALQISPQVRFVVFYITSTGELIADSIALAVEDYFVNKISLSFSKNQTEPGDESVTLNVQTTRNSFVGLLGVDQSVLLMHAGNDITQQAVSDELKEYTRMYYGGYIPMRFKRSIGWPIYTGGTDTSTLLNNAGLFVLTNLYIQMPEYFTEYYDVRRMPGIAGPEGPVMTTVAPSPAGLPAPPPEAGNTPNNAAPVTVRKDFPETFIWTDVVADGKGGLELKVKVPGTITSWVATGFSVSSQLGLGVSESPATLTVVKPFFISLNLPYSIVRGEEFALQVTVFNYYGKDLEADVKLASSQYFKVIDCQTKKAEHVEAVRRVKVGNNDATAVYFWIVATALDHIAIEVSALAGVAADAMRAKLLVKLEGQPQTYSVSDFIQINAGETYDNEFEVKFPPTGFVTDSIHLEVTLIGDVIGSSLNGIENLLMMPYGCGEQNLLTFAPDVFIMIYLQVSAQLTPTIQQKALKYINSGYQRQLTYQRKDGSFSAFGERDISGSTWLSAFTIKCFHQAKGFIPVEDDKIATTLNWIIDNQADNGTFHEPPGGRVIHSNMQGGSSLGVAMTAYVLISLLENKENPNVDSSKLQGSITKATNLLESSYSTYSTDAYVLSIMSYALYKAQSPSLSDVLTLLEGLALTEDGMKYWNSKPDVPTSQWKSPYGKPKSYNVELAAYVLLVYAQQQDLSMSLPIAKWLLSKRNAQGGFSSTQDTVLALEALSAFASLVVPPTNGSGIVVTLKDNLGTVLHTYDPITRANSLFLQSYQYPGDTTAVNVGATGEGVGLVQLIVSYNVEMEDKSQFLTLDLSTESDREGIVLGISASWKGDEETGMILIEVDILTGFSLVDEGSLKRQIGDTFKKLEKSHNKLAIYLDQLTESPISFQIRLKEILAVSNVKPALVKVYPYYDTDSVASSFYSSKAGQTWEGACPLCCA